MALSVALRRGKSKIKTHRRGAKTQHRDERGNDLWDQNGAGGHEHRAARGLVADATGDERHEQEGAARHEPAERTETSVSAVPPDASFTGLAAFATAGREADEESTREDTVALGRRSTEHRTEESD